MSCRVSVRDVTARARLVPVLFSLLAACGGGGSSGGSGDATTEAIDCSGLTWSATVAEPLDRVSVRGVPEAVTPLFVEVGTTDDAIQTFTFATRQTDGSVEVVVPIHPSGDPDGGPAVLTVTDGVTRCAAEPFDLAALPEPPAGTDPHGAVAQRLATLVDLQAGSLGLPAEYFDTVAVENLSDWEVPLFLAHRYARAFADPAAAGADSLTDPERELLDRLLAKSGTGSYLQNLIDRFEAMPTGLARAPDAARRLTEAGRGGSDPPQSPMVRMALTLISPARAAAPECASLVNDIVEAPEISDAATLSAYMTEQTDANGKLNGPSTKKVARDLGHVATAAGVVSGAVGVAAGGALYALSIYNQYRTNLYPSEFTSIDFDVEPRIEEDRMDPSGPGILPRWQNARVHATNRGWNLTRATLQGFLQLASVKVQVAGRLNPQPSGIAEDVIGLLEGIGWSELISALGDSDCLQIQRHVWGPIDITDSMWSDRTWFGDAVTPSGHQTFEPAKIGDSDLRVKPRTDKFGGHGIEEDKTVSIVRKRIVEVSVLPGKVLDPGDTATLSIAVANSSLPQTPPEWTWNAGTEVDRYSVDQTHTLELQTPTNEADFPILVTADATDTTLTLEPTSPRRLKTIELDSSSLELTPASLCLRPDEVATLTATTATDKEVLWTKTGGTLSDSSTISTSGTHEVLYTAPGTEGEYTITATRADNSDIDDTATVSVGPCVDVYVLRGAVAAIDPPPQSSAGDCPAEPNDDKESAEVIDTPPLLPERPAGGPWRDRSEAFVEFFQRDYEGRVWHTPTETGASSGECFSFNASALASADLLYSGSSDGEASLSGMVDAEYNVTIDPVTAEVLSSGGTSRAQIEAYHYVEINAPGTYRLKIDLACSLSTTDPGVTLPGSTIEVGDMILNVALSRLIGTSGDITSLNYCSLRGDCGPSGIGIVSPTGELFGGDPVQSRADLSCPGDFPLTYTEDFEVLGPVTDGETDTVVIRSTADTPHLAGSMEAGTHRGNAAIDYTIQFAPVTP